MAEPLRPRAKYVIGPDGSPLTIADLPAPGTKRWVIRRGYHAQLDELHKGKAVRIVIDEKIDIASLGSLITSNRAEQIKRGGPELSDLGCLSL